MSDDFTAAFVEDAAKYILIREEKNAKYEKIETISKAVFNAIASTYRKMADAKNFFADNQYSDTESTKVLLLNYQKIVVPEAEVSIVSAYLKVYLPPMANDHDEHYQANKTIKETTNNLVSRVADKLLDKNVYLIKGIVTLQYDFDYEDDMYIDRPQMNLSFVYIEGI